LWILTFNSPESPAATDWLEHYPTFTGQHEGVTIADIGCGFGGLLFALSPRLQDTLILGKIEYLSTLMFPFS
jgi:tRNA (guanine-N7-)-methyltransferase